MCPALTSYRRPTRMLCALSSPQIQLIVAWHRVLVGSTAESGFGIQMLKPWLSDCGSDKLQQDMSCTVWQGHGHVSTLLLSPVKLKFPSLRKATCTCCSIGYRHGATGACTPAPGPTRATRCLPARPFLCAGPSFKHASCSLQ